MSTRNFGYRVSPRGGQRGARYVLGGSAKLPLGVPVVTTGADDGLGRAVVELATGAQAPPANGQGGILDYEEIVYAGVDPNLTTYSDMDTAPVGAAVQVVSGDTVKVVFKNTTPTEDASFLARQGYPVGRTMVAGAGATPTIAVGDYLTPGVGDDEDGYWAETADPSEAWLVVTSINPETGEVEARMTF